MCAQCGADALGRWVSGDRGVWRSLIYQAQGRFEEAREISRLTSKVAFEQRNTLFRQVADAFQAELALRQGRIAEADQWARQFKSGELHSLQRFFIPELTWVKVLLARGTTDGNQKADTFLRRIYDFQVPTHNANCLIDILALQALLYDALSEESTAFEKISEALTLAEPGDFIRPFLDLGPPMFDLLNRLAKRKSDIRYIGKLLTAFRNERNAEALPESPDSHLKGPDSVSPADVVETLTKRELEIPDLLVQRLSNKEIADKLYISPETVKRHVYNIYQKLNVSTRREAANKAAVLGIFKE